MADYRRKFDDGPAPAPHRQIQRRSSDQQLERQHRGRRPTQYTDSYAPKAFSRKNKLKRSSSLDRSEDDGDHARDHLKQGTTAAAASPVREGQESPTHPNGSAAETQPNNTREVIRQRQRRASVESRSSQQSSSKQSRQSSSSTKKSEPTEQQIAEYAGKRALLRLEQEFADSSAHNRDDHGHEYFRSVMDRRKLARVPQVNKQDLIIGEYLGRGNFCDVFEVKWILEDERYSRARQCTGSARQFSSSVTISRPPVTVGDDSNHSMENRTSTGDRRVARRKIASSITSSFTISRRPSMQGDSNHSIEDLESNMESMALQASNDLSLLADESSGAPRPRTRRSISQVSVLLNATPASFRDPNVLALKCLRPAVRVQPRKFVIGAEDLAHETALLACLDHPNIITLYGRAEGCFSKAFQMRPKSVEDNYDTSTNGEGKKMSNEGYFIILDRLMATLTGRIDEWMDECRAITGAMTTAADGSPPSPNRDDPDMPPETNLREHLYKRLKVAYCIADALEYLHSRHVVFRDLKPANVGFDCNDCVKIFDFGFATSIAPLLNQEYQGYGPLTETCGTRRYMAPEVALKLGYGKEVDVYSFGMLLWEICVLEKPFDSIQSVEEFHDLVVLCGKRPSLHSDPLWTPSLKHLMSRCWSTDPLDRPTMVEVKTMLCNVLRDMNMKEMQNGDGSSGQPQEPQQHNFISKWRRRVSL